MKYNKNNKKIKIIKLKTKLDQGTGIEMIIIRKRMIRKRKINKQTK